MSAQQTLESRDSHDPGEERVEYLVIGQIVAPRGVRGELKVRIESDDAERFLDLERVYLGDERRLFRVESARLFKGFALLQLAGVDDREHAEALRRQYVYVHLADALPLTEDEYYHHEIEGLRVVSESGEELGYVDEVLVTGANEVYIVKGPQG